MPILTVEEQLEFTASLCFASNVGPKVRRNRIQQVLCDLIVRAIWFCATVDDDGERAGAEGRAIGARGGYAHRRRSRPRHLGRRTQTPLRTLASFLHARSFVESTRRSFLHFVVEILTYMCVCARRLRMRCWRGRVCCLSMSRRAVSMQPTPSLS